MKTNKVLATMVPLMVASVAFGQQINTTLNGERVRFDGAQPMMVNGRVLVPLRGVFEQMGAYVHWNSDTRTVNVRNDAGKHVLLRIGDHFAQVDGHNVALDSPAIMVTNRTMVPLRFISESMGAHVNWDEAYRTVAITTVVANQPATSGSSSQPMVMTFSIPENTVVPFKLNQQLTSDGSSVGQRFTATIDTSNSMDYVGLPAGTIVSGHVDAIRPMSSKLPGVLSLAFDHIQLPNGRVVTIDGSLTGLDNKSVENDNGRLVARQPSTKNVKYVGIGAGAGALIAVVTDRNILTTAAIGAALGYLYDSTNHKPVQHSDVTLRRGTAFGVMMNRDHSFPVSSRN